MLQKSAWSHSSGGIFSASLNGDSTRKTSCTTSDDNEHSNQHMISSDMDPIGSKLCADDPILGDQTAAVDNNLYHYQMNNASHSDNDLDLFSNNLQDKGSGDLLYYGWSEMENFDDVERMFRNCDSTFGLGIDNDDELGWFSSQQGIEGSDDALESTFNFSDCDPGALNSVTGHQDVYDPDNTDVVANEISKKLTDVSWRRDSPKPTHNGPSTVTDSSNANGSGAIPHIQSDSPVHSQVRLSKPQKPSEGKRKERSSENGDSYSHFDNLTQVGESNNSLNFQSSISSENHQQETMQQTFLEKQQIPLTSSDNSHPPNHVLPSAESSIIKSEDSELPSISPRESSYASSKMKPKISGHKKKERLHQRRLSSHPGKSHLAVQKADSDQIPVQKQVPKFENEVEGQSEVNGSDNRIQGELDSTNMLESTCMSSVLDEVSIEASSFRQLQHVMEQLDIRTKLCIRDSLYRLARSAEQRHKCGNQTSNGRDDKDASGASICDGTTKVFHRCTGFMDMETDTNPIDRSIAHLLFHRPSDPSATAGLDTVPVKSHTMVHAPNHGTVTAEKLVCQEETTSAIDDASEN